MSEILTVLALALLPPAGNFVGGMLAEVLPTSEAWLNRALHAAVGVVMAVVAVEIFPEALDILPGWALAGTFLVGGTAYLAAEALIDRFATSGEGEASRMWMIYLAVATDLFGDGLMIGAGVSVSTGLGVLLALGQVLADVPEGFASILTFRANRVPRGRRIALAASFSVPALVAATVAYLVLRNRSEALQMAALVGTAGLFFVAALEDMILEAHETSDDSKVSTMALIGGFVLFILVAAGVG